MIMRATQKKRMSEPGNQQAGRIKRGKIAQGCIPAIFRHNLRPAKNRNRQQSRREPRVQHIGFLRNLFGAAMGADRRVFARHRDLVARCAMPRRNPMPPPELPRNAPVVNVVHPLEIGLLVHLRRKANVLFAHSLFGLVRQRLNLDKPLRREPRLHHRLAAVAEPHGVRMVLHRHQQPCSSSAATIFLRAT